MNPPTWLDARGRTQVAAVTITLLLPATALVGQGWYLMEPPITRTTVDRSALLHRWTQIQAFDSAKGCEAAVATRTANASRDLRDPANEFRRAALEAALFWRCVATDDTRLKP